MEGDALHLDNVHNAGMVTLQSDGDLHGGGIELELIAQIVDNLPRVGPLPIELVHERQAGDVVSLHLPIDGQALRLDTGHTTEDQDATVEDTEGTLDLDGKVDVTGRIDNVDVSIAPSGKGGGTLDGDALLAFEVHGIHLGTDSVLAADVVDGVDPAGVEQDAFGQGGLATDCGKFILYGVGV